MVIESGAHKLRISGREMLERLSDDYILEELI